MSFSNTAAGHLEMKLRRPASTCASFTGCALPGWEIWVPLFPIQPGFTAAGAASILPFHFGGLADEEAHRVHPRAFQELGVKILKYVGYMRQEKGRGEDYGSIVGAARLGDRASIGNGYWMSAHGGAVCY